MGGCFTCCHGLLVLLLLLSSFSQQTAAAPSTRNRLLARLLNPSGPACEPWSVPEAERCAYVRDHAAICYPDGGFQAYLGIHFCWFPPYWRWVSLMLLLVAAALAFAVLMTVSERFFCPALELISDYLKLPPVVAGATLLSFGNGAPDTFTQVAAVGQEGGAAVGMALSEPLGGGMFASNVVFGLVVLIASKQQAVIPRASFLKDVAFYLGSLVVVAYMLGDGKVTALEAGALLGMYVVYVCVTFYTSRTDEPLHADLALHEFPPEDGGIDAHDSGSEDFNFESSDIEHPEYIDATTSIRDFDLEAPYAEVHTDVTSVPAQPAAPPSAAGGLSGPSTSSSGPDTTAARQAAAGSSSSPAGQGSSGSRTLQALLSWRHRSSNPGLHEPLLLSIAESPAQPLRGNLASKAATDVSFEANSGGDTVDGHRGCHRSASTSTEVAGRGLPGHKAQLNAREPSLADMLRDGAAQSASSQQQQQGAQTDSASESEESLLVSQEQLTGSSSSNGSAAPSALSSGGGRAGGLPSPVFAQLAGPDLQGVVPPTHSSSNSRRGFAAHGSRTFTEGTRLRGHSLSPVAPSDRTADASSSSLAGWSPRAASDSGLPPAALTGYNLLAGPPVSPRLLGALPYSLTLPRSQPATPRMRRASEPVGGLGAAAVPSSPLHQLHQQHFAEQQELLEQQAAEHDALLAAHEDQQDVLKAGGMSLKHRLQYPFVQLLSCTMPRVGTGSGHRFGRWRACLLPLTVPLLWFAADPSLMVGMGWLGLVFGCSCAAVGSGIIWATYPASDVLRKALKGVFAVLAFFQAIVWLNLSASGLVQICVVVGTIFGLQPALLGATVLAWGNSVPDVINNTAMARDGFPSMAVAACFASPLFTLLCGMGGALAYGTILHHGPLPVPVDGPLMVMAGFSIVSMVQHLTVVPWVAKYRMRPSLAVLTFLFYACFNVVYVLATVGVFHIQPLQPGPA